MRTIAQFELHQHLLRCAGTEDFGDRPCERMAEFVGWAMRPASEGRRTDLTLFGVCQVHVFHRRGIEAQLASEGFYGASLVPRDQLHEVLEMLEEARLLKVVA